MATITVDEIVQATGGKVLFGKPRAFNRISIDSRTTRSGELFVALRGDRFDGHDFVAAALNAGSGALVSMPPADPPRDRTVIYVKNTLRALQDIARSRRADRNVPVVCITGTNGKTTTKELVAGILGQRHRVLKTSGNLNNHIGLPLCVANMDGDEDYLVLEMGSNARGDIRELCAVARPDIAVVTNVGEAHLEGFGTIAAVRDTDLEVLEYVRTVCINADDPLLMEGISTFDGRVVTYGIDHPADFSAREITFSETGTAFVMVMPSGEEVPVHLLIAGRFNVLNALAAAAGTAELGLGSAEIRQGLEAFAGVPMRLEIRYAGGALVINDVYNANPASMEGALGELSRRRTGRAIAVLGDMLELGAHAADAHRQLVSRLNELQVDVLIAVGPEMQAAAKGFAGAAYSAESSPEAGSLLSGMLGAGDAVLIKGSRGMRMERVLEAVEAGHAV